MTPLAHATDPDASHIAASSVDRHKSERVKSALLSLLHEEPRTAFELQDAYFWLAELNGWPFVQPYSINRRVSDLRGAGMVRPVMVAGVQVRRPSPSGSTATVWEVVS